MFDLKRLLIPTKDERTWKFDMPVLFLGTWCCTKERESVWRKLNFKLAEPYGIEAQQRESDLSYVRKIEAMLFPELCNTLNIVHGVNYSDRYWQILLGSWFRNFISLLFNRSKSLMVLENLSQVNSIIGPVKNFSYNLATVDSTDATWAVNDNIWNHFLTLEIIKAGKLEIIEIPEMEHLGINFFRSSEEIEKFNKISVVRNIFNSIMGLFTRKSDALIISTYLSLKAEILLQIMLGQAPRWFVPKRFVIPWDISVTLREQASALIVKKTNDEIENVIRQLLFKLIPICYLEGYNELQTLSEKSGFPKTPRFIFTSNSFEYDEVFKIYAATESEKMTPLIYGQHGNNYGTSKYLSPTIEEITCDKFLTWGWSKESPKYVPAFLLRNASLKINSKLPQKRLLLIEHFEDHRRRTWDTHWEYREFLEEQKIFLQNLSHKPYSELLLRLSSQAELFSSGDKKYWQEFDESIQIDGGESHIYTLFGNSKIVVHSYDSTGLLETLSKGIPSIAFWRNGLDHLHDSVKNDYQTLIDVGIIHTSGKSAANHINYVWEDVSNWWNLSEVKSARENFCKIYALHSRSPVNELKVLLNIHGEKTKPTF
jgi:putative transferase (TIGR04331 family)